MTIWYAISSFVLIFIASGLLYAVLVTTLEKEDVRDLADNLNNTRLLLRPRQPNSPLPLNEGRPAWAPQFQPQIYLRVLDQNARVLVETPGASAELPRPSVADLAAIRAPDGETRELVSRSGQPFLTLIVPVSGSEESGSRRYMQVAMDRTREEHLLARYRERLWLVLSVSLVLSSLGGYALAHSGLRPIQVIAATAERIRSSTLHERIDASRLPGELSGLAETFNKMLDRLEASFGRISRFSDDAAHELRTPINNMRGEMEVVLSRARSGDEYRETLESCLEECTRITWIVETLLFLARTEAGTDSLVREEIAVGKELTAVQEFYGATAAECGIRLATSAAPDLRAQLNKTLFQQAIGNLVSNSLAHTPPGGTVRIAAQALSNCLEVIVTDTGYGIPPEHLPRVFDRFYRVDRARSGSEHKSGLGLSVVKSIVGCHGGKVEITSEVGAGTEVRMTFPQPA